MPSQAGHLVDRAPGSEALLGVKLRGVARRGRGRFTKAGIVSIIWIVGREDPILRPA